MCDTAVLVIDMVNAYRHPDADLIDAALDGRRPDPVEPIGGLARAALPKIRRTMAASPTSAAHRRDGPLPSRR